MEMVGEPFPPSTVVAGSDCDDDDASLTPADVDGDGFTFCNGGVTTSPSTPTLERQREVHQQLA